MPCLNNQVYFQWLPSLPFLKAIYQVCHSLYKYLIVSIVIYLAIIIVKLYQAFIIEYQQGPVKSIYFLFRLVPPVLVCRLDLPCKFLPESTERLFSIDPSDIIQAWQCIKAIQIKHSGIQEMVIEYIICIDHFLVI